VTGNIDIEAGLGAINSEARSITNKAKLGDVSIQASKGSVSIEALNNISIKCGDSSIELNSDGIDLKIGQAFLSLNDFVTSIGFGNKSTDFNSTGIKEMDIVMME
jgi:uncharacterized protein (DUF2345 family)